ncbi:unnamed protein product [Peniophora sp. CBMAI 1063]|nr:unnamed protein product [Peniophora sp. CBMAI 1063]
MPARKRTATSPTPALRTSKRQRVKPARTPQVVSNSTPPPRKPKPAKAPKLTPEEAAEKEREELVAAITQAQSEFQEERAKTHGAPYRDAELYLQDPYMYRPLGEGEPTELSGDEMIVCMAENVLFRLPRPALIDVAQLFADMFSIPFPPGEDVDGRTDDHPVVLHGIGAEGLRQAIGYQLTGGARDTCHACVHMLVFAHRTGGYDLYEQTALLLANNFVTLEPPWARQPRRAYCGQYHSQPRQPYGSIGLQCYDNKHCIKDIASHPHPDDKPEPDKTSTVDDAFYPECHSDKSDDLTWGWYNNHYAGPKGGLPLGALSAIDVLVTAFELGIDVRFFPGALVAIIHPGEFLTPQMVARLTRMDDDSPLAIADCIMTHRNRIEEGSDEEPEVSVARIGQGSQLVHQLHRAIKLWKYCTRLKGEGTWGMLNTVIRTVWDAPNENSDGWIFMCEKP